MIKIVEYVVLFDEGVRKRHYHKSVRGKIIEFAVQLEVFIESNWRPIIRYDCAHGFAHIDHYDRRGKRRRRLLDLNFNEAIILADEDIRENWEKYREDFLKEV